MIIIYVVYFLLLYVSYKIIKICLFISPELRQIPSLPLIQTFRWNKSYLVGEPFIHIIRNHLMESLNNKGIIKVYDIIFGKWVIFISKPELIKETFLNPDAFQKASRKGLVTPAEIKFVGYNNILFVTNNEHIRHRRTVNPSLSHNWPPELFGDLAIELFEKIDKLCEKNSSVDVYHTIKAYTFDVLGLAAFGYNFGLIQDSGNELEKAYNAAVRAMSNQKYYVFPFLEKTPGFKRTELMNQIDYLNNVTLNIIEKRRQLLKNKKFDDNDDDYDGPRDLLYYMLRAENSQESKARLTTEELLNDLKIFLVAGHETTAIALSAAIYFLGMNQECQEKAREEVIRIMGDEKKDVIPTPKQIKELKYINLIIYETLRIHPPIPMPSPREAQKDTKLGEYVIKKGSYVGLNVYSSHHAKKTWENPYKFKPERFEDDKDATSRLFPFGGGQRICVGMNFSYAEQRVFLAMLVRKYSWNIIEPNVHSDKLKITPALLALAVPDKININFKRRY